MARVARRPDRFIHDYRYVRYVTADAELTLVADAKHADGDTTGVS